MSLLTTQTAINTTTDFFATSAGVVESVQQGSNVVLGGTANDPVINVPGPFVRQITQGSNITASGTSNITLNVPTGAGGSSATNIPVPSSAPGTPVVQITITDGNIANYYNVASALLPGNGSNVYRFTGNFFVVSGTCSGPGGNISVLTTLQPSNQVIACSSAYCSSNATSGPTTCFFSQSAEFIPASGDSLTIKLRNNTGGPLSNLVLDATPKGCAIELVSSASAPVLIFS